MKDNPSIPNQIRARLGKERLSALALQPACMAAGGIDTVLQTAATLTAGYPDPLTAATIRTLQLCGSPATPADLASSSSTNDP